jgi:hypothetical protein
MLIYLYLYLRKIPKYLWNTSKYLLLIVSVVNFISLCKVISNRLFEKPRPELNKKKLEKKINKYDPQTTSDKLVIGAIKKRLAQEETVYTPYQGPLQFDEDVINSLLKMNCPFKTTNILLSSFDMVKILYKSSPKFLSDYPVLHYAARYGSLSLIKHLIECGLRFDLAGTRNC